MSEKATFHLAGANMLDPNENRWSNGAVERLLNLMAPHDITLLNPLDRDDDLSNPITTVGRNALLCLIADFMIVDASTPCDLSLGADLVLAKENNIIVVSIVPPTSPYNQGKTTVLNQVLEEYVHPYIAAYSDIVVESLEEAARWVNSFMSGEVSCPLKDNTFSLRAMDAYLCDESEEDKSFMQLLETNPHFEDVISNVSDIIEELTNDSAEAEDEFSNPFGLHVGSKH